MDIRYFSAECTKHVKDGKYNMWVITRSSKDGKHTIRFKVESEVWSKLPKLVFEVDITFYTIIKYIGKEYRVNELTEKEYVELLK